MSKMMMRSDRKPPLALRSPIRLRSRIRPVQSTVNNLQTPSGYGTKSRLPKPLFDLEESELRPEYHTISDEFQALSKMVQDNLWGSTTNQSANANNGNPMFERGRLYEEYSARRNERLRRKKGEYGVEKKSPCKQFLGVRVESSKKTGEVKKFESARKMTTPLVERKEAVATSRYSLRSSSKENKKPPLAMSYGTVDRKTTTVRRTARKGY
ncbi:uncharacterized protein [Rutidosis leptorrhynchoides]|uniref:uncharacterized protein n=1 Tax=Rutidosis leptorrhynchoides TaxID=125765 RepID=UPI003A99168E